MLELEEQPGLAPRLQLLPRCKALTFSITGNQHISWAALSPETKWTQIWLGALAELHFCDCPAIIVESTEEPGLLEIMGFLESELTSSDQVTGLPGLSRTNPTRNSNYRLSISKSGAAGR